MTQATSADEETGAVQEVSVAPTRRARLHAAAVRAWAEASLAALGDERATIDALNVFPVPDGDTGTNMFLTVESACSAIQEACDISDASGRRPNVDEVAAAMARGALLGARGNSGVILAQIVRGVGSVLADADEGAEITPVLIRDAMRRASDEAYAAVSRPVEGTILTVARAAAEAAEKAEASGDDLVAVIERAVAASHEALAQTTQQLPALRDAGVVDAGGQGLVVVYDALLDVVTGVSRRRPGRASRPKLPSPTRTPVPSSAADPAYEVMYLLTTDAQGIGDLRARLESLGDSLMITGDDDLWNVHVHVHDAGAAIEAGIATGPIERIRVTYLAEASPAALPEGRGLVVVTHGPGTTALVTDQGVVAVPARPRRRPSTAELLDGIRQAHAGEVVLLPSDSDSLAVAEAAAEQARAEGLRISVIPSRSIVQSLAAVAVHDPAARFDDDVVAMTRAAGATRYGAVTIASKAALTSAGPCEEGDVLGIADGDIVDIGRDVADVAASVAARLLSTGGELLTLVLGEDADRASIARLADDLQRGHAGIDVIEIDGGQPLWPVIIGVE